VAAGALLAGLLVVLQGASAQSRKQIVAGSVAVIDGGITGSFEVKESSSGIVSTGTGGACLVFSELSVGRSDCKTAEDCTLDPQFAGGHAYCLQPVNEGTTRGKCWVSPPGNYCLRSPTVPHPLDTKIELPLDAAGKLQPVIKPLPGWWRVHACLNGNASRACGGEANAEALISDGPPTKVP